MNIGILGATGLVGQTFLNLLKDSPIPLNKLFLFASEKSQGQTVKFKNQDLTVEVLSEEHFKNLDLLFIATGNDLSLHWSPIAVKHGCYVVDNSSAFRMHPECALIVPEVNFDDIKKDKPQIIANPNCSTIQLTLPLKALANNYGIKSVKVASYQSVSGAGKEAQQELIDQSKQPEVDFKPVNFTHPIAFNTIPQIGNFLDDGFSSEEDKIMMETRKILNLPNLNISAFTVRVPSLNGHAEVLWVELDKVISKTDLLKSLAQMENLVISEDGFHVVREVSGQKEVFVGRLHQDRFNPNTWIMWVVADNLLKGAAWNALQIAELLFEPKS
jgi:aspartate-semialdehyde dehydrogenase